MSAQLQKYRTATALAEVREEAKDKLLKSIQKVAQDFADQDVQLKKDMA
jgi:hypothetical protein